MGFAIGSEHDTHGKPLIEVMHLIEYASIDPENRLAKICADVIMENTSNRAARLSLIHPGNINLYAATNRWEYNQMWTLALAKTAALDVGLQQEDDGLYFFNPHKGQTRLHLLTNPTTPLKGWRPNREADEPYFTGILSPELEPRKHYLFRVMGDVTEESYGPFDSKWRDGEFRIDGGMHVWYPILGEIESPVISEHGRSMFIHPDYHHFIVEMADGSPMKVTYKSTDITQEAKNVPIDGRKLNWLWSDSDLIKHMGANGPQTEFARQEAESGARKSWFGRFIKQLI